MKARESSNDDELVEIFVKVLKVCPIFDAHARPITPSILWQICIFLGNYHQVPNYVSMAQKYRWGHPASSSQASKSGGVNASGGKDALSSQLSCFSGLMYLDSEKYEPAADSFLEVSVRTSN